MDLEEEREKEVDAKENATQQLAVCYQPIYLPLSNSDVNSGQEFWFRPKFLLQTILAHQSAVIRRSESDVLITTRNQ